MCVCVCVCVCVYFSFWILYFQCGLHVFSNSLIKFTLCTFILSHDLVNSCITIFKNSSCKLFHYFSQVFCFTLQIEITSILLNFLCFYEFRSNIYQLQSWRCVLTWRHAFADCLPNAFRGRFGFDVGAKHSFPQGVLAAITLVGGGAGDGEARAGVGHKAGLSGHHCPIRGGDWS